MRATGRRLDTAPGKPLQWLAMQTKIRFRLRITQGDTIAVGPGKVALLEAIIDTGSISAAARKLGMSYRRAWMLVDEMNRSLKAPVVDTATGGKHGGGTAVTPTGREVIKRYRTIERDAAAATARDLRALTRLLAE